jgi:hypothetical protein
MRLSSQNGFRLIRKFEEAVRADEWAGAAPPEDRDGIERRCKLAREKLQRFLVECLLIPSDVETKEMTDEQATPRGY